MFEKLMRRKNVDGQKPESSQTLGSTASAKSPKNDSATVPQSDIIQSRKAIQHLWGADGEKIADFVGCQEMWVISLTKLTTAIIFLWQLIGFVPLGAGLLSFGAIIPCGVYATKLAAEAQRHWVHMRDEKQVVVGESINGLRQIKFSASEAEWERRIEAVRERELKALWRLTIVNSIHTTLWRAMPVALAAASLITYALIYGYLTPSLTFGKSARQFWETFYLEQRCNSAS